MTDKAKPNRPKARVAKGFRDIDADEIRGTRAMLATIQRVYESYGFEPVEQPFIEYTDALGKFLPDQDRPNAGVFSFQDDDEQWLSLRYDLTAPLARFVAENTQGQLPTPYRSYRQGWVFRNEKPGPGRFRQFMQFDADTVGSSSPAADAEVCMRAADPMEALEFERGQYVIVVSNRKLIDALFDVLLIPEELRMTVLRCIDKWDRLGEAGVIQLLTTGRKDDSGDVTVGAGLSQQTSKSLLDTLSLMRNFVPYLPFEEANDLERTFAPKEFDGGKKYPSYRGLFATFESLVGHTDKGKDAISELKQISELLIAGGYGPDCIRIDPSVVRGLEYYTGPVFECELLMEVTDENGSPIRFGSVGGGGRYDGLVSRFTGQLVPATGFSIGVSRLYSALQRIRKPDENKTLAPVVVTVMDKDRQGDYWKMVQALRNADPPIRAEMYVGTSNMGKQMKYADKRGAPLVVIQGGDEKAAGQVQIKDLRLGSELAANIATREEYASQRLAQVTVPEADLVAQVQKMLQG